MLQFLTDFAGLIDFGLQLCCARSILTLEEDQIWGRCGIEYQTSGIQAQGLSTWDLPCSCLWTSSGLFSYGILRFICLISLFWLSGWSTPSHSDSAQISAPKTCPWVRSTFSAPECIEVSPSALEEVFGTCPWAIEKAALGQRGHRWRSRKLTVGWVWEAPGELCRLGSISEQLHAHKLAHACDL